jgi:GT2 family glycosyltransferase
VRLSVVIASRNTVDLLRECLVSLEADGIPGADAEVIVVDNGSDDGSPAMVATEFPSVRLIRNAQNLGFSRANNQGLRASVGDYMALLNSDTRVTPGALRHLASFLEAHEDVGAVGPMLVSPNGSVQPSCSTFLSLRAALFEQLFLDKLFLRSRLFGAHYLTWWSYDQARDVDVLGGACLMAPRNVWRAVGLLDERYFMYCEDADWCLRCHRSGLRRVYLPTAQVAHHHGASSRTDRGSMVLAYNVSRCIYFATHHGLVVAERVRRIAIAGSALRLWLWRAKAATGRALARNQVAMWRGVLTGLRELNVAALPLEPQIPALQ